MTDAFIAIVASGSPITGYLVSPQIVEHDGTPHPQILVKPVQGITPIPGDYVLILTTRNALNNNPVQRYFEASESNGRIVAIVKTLDKFSLTGNYKFIGDVSILGDFDVIGDSSFLGKVEITGQAKVLGPTEITGTLDITGDVNITGTVDITGSLIINGSNYTTHTHANNAPAPGPTGPPI